MTAPAKAPARRLLATYPTPVEAAAAAIWWAGPPEHAQGVKIEQGVRGTIPERPYGVTADRGGGGS